MIETLSNQSLEKKQEVFENAVGTGQRYFIISRGKTRHPKREIRTSEYWIGAGEGCDLRLGGAGIPSLHSVLKYERGTSIIESIESIPALRVNGSEVETHELADGDLVEIGPFQLEFRQQELRDAVEIPIEDSTKEKFDSEEEFDLADLSAEDLVDLLEADMNLVEEDEKRKRDGLEALMTEVQSRMPSLEKKVAQPKTRNNDVVEEFVRITHQLCEHVTKLDLRVSQISERDDVYTSAFSDLLESQKLLSKHLETLISHLASKERSEQHSQSSRFAA